MTFINRRTDEKIQRQFEYHQIMDYVNDFKTYIRSFECVGATEEGLTNLAARCGANVHAYLNYITRCQILFFERKITKIKKVNCKPYKIF